MKTVWTKGLNKEDAEEIRQIYVGSARFRAKLTELLTEKANSRRAGALSEESYVNPNWAYVQADSIGYERALKEIISLISEK